MKNSQLVPLSSFLIFCCSAGCSGDATGEGPEGSGGGLTASGGMVGSGASSGTGSSTGSGSTQGTGAETGGGAAPGSGAAPGTGGVMSGTGSMPGSGGTGPVDVDGKSATDLVASWDMGWNVGNSLDVPEGETAWGNPKITAELMQTVAAAGFDVVRIPVTWSLHTGAGPDFVIEESFLMRVQEVVDYVQAAGMSAIINIHHDGADSFNGPVMPGGVEWLTLNDAAGDVTDANNQAVEDRFVKVWTQIANYFKDEDESLLFESMNEIHDGYDAPDPAYYSIINHLNQTFVDLVRGSGGKNASRHLVVPGYNTNIDYSIEGFEKPNDTVSDHLILSIHFYDPYTYAINADTHTWGAASPGSDDWGQEDHVTSQFDKLKMEFIDQGLPMIMGEYGAPNQDGYEDYRRYYLEYVTKAATDRGMVPVYWDNGGTGSGADNFGLFDRTTYSVVDQAALDAIVRAATSDYSIDYIALPMP